MREITYCSLTKPYINKDRMIDLKKERMKPNNKVNYLSGKEWLKKAKNYWFYEDLSEKKYVKDMFDFGYQNRENGKYQIDELTSEHNFDFTLNHIHSSDSFEKLQSVLSTIANSNYNSYHFIILENEVNDYNNCNVIMTSLSVDTLLKVKGLEYRGKIILHDSQNKINKALLFLNRATERPNNIEIPPLSNYYIKYDPVPQNIINSRTKLDKFALKHPAAFSYIDIEKLMISYLNNDDKVLDPFIGSGSTVIAQLNNDCYVTGIDISSDYIKLVEERIENLDVNNSLENRYDLYCGDAYSVMDKLPKSYYDGMITSPPYHNILRNAGKGVRHDNSQSRQGVNYYTEDHLDLGNLKTYDDYIISLEKIFEKSIRLLKSKAKIIIIISDFTVNRIEKDVHGKLIQMFDRLGCVYKGTDILLQNQKSIYPFGFPYKIVLNHIFQYAIIFEVR